jgi:xylosylprotein 4-beta-galactosyltransferase
MIKHKLAIIVPYRNRAKHLIKFAPYITKYLNNQNINFKIFVIEQIEDKPFNKGLLFNVGVKLLDDSFDYVVLHDVDLLPTTLSDNVVDYSFSETPKHLISHYIESHDNSNILVNYLKNDNDDVMKYIKDAKIRIDKKVHLENGFGGIVKMSIENFKQINGFSNQFWGWGFEDDDLLERVKKSGLSWDRQGAGFVRSIPHQKFDKSTNDMIFKNQQELETTKITNTNDNGYNELKDQYSLIETKIFKLFTKITIEVEKSYE